MMVYDNEAHTTLDYNLSLDNAGWNAAEAVFGRVKHLLCRWHIGKYVQM